MISIKQVISQIEAFATAHKQIKKFGFEFFEQMPNLATVDEKFPYMFVTPVGATTYENMVEFDLDVYCVDRLQKDRTNMKFTVSDTQLILSDLSVWLEDGDHDIDVERIYPQTPINNALLDYVDGWAMKIKVQVDRIELCEVPMDGITPYDDSCPDATYEITDTDDNILYSGSISSGGTLNQPIQDSTVSITDDIGNVLHTVTVLAEGSATQAISDSTVTITDDSANTLYTLSVNAEGTANQIIADSTVNINNSAATLLHSVSVNAEGVASQTISDSTVTIKDDSNNTLYTLSVVAEGSANQVISDSTAVLKTTGGATISTTSINAQASANITAPDTALEVNGVSEGSVVAGSTVDVQLSDSGGTVTPTSVTQVGNDLQIVLPDAPVAVTRSTATLMRTGQTTVYRTGDDADRRAEGRATDFLTLDSAPLHNDGTATLNATTNRFTDTLGGQTYANDIVLDWSTWNGSTLLGWYRVVSGLQNWNNSIDNALLTSISSFTTGWRLPNITELSSLMEYENATAGLNYTPFSGITSTLNIWTSTTVPTATSNAYRISNTTRLSASAAKTGTSTWIPVRTFSLSLLNVLS